MSDDQKQALKVATSEALKEGARLAICAFVGYVLDTMLAWFTKNPTSGQAMATLTLLVRLSDNFWHQYNKDMRNGEPGEPKGFLPF